MEGNKFLFSVADVWVLDGNDNIIIKSKTMLNTNMEVSTSSTEISGGKRNKLLNVLYHSGRLNLTLEDNVYNMEWIKQNTGAKDIASAAIPTSVSLMKLKAGENVINTTDDILALDGSDTAYIYLTNDNGVTKKFAVTDKKFTLPSNSEFIGKNVCGEYFTSYVADKSISIPAAIVPNRARLFLKVDIAGNKAGEGVIGDMTIEVPSFQFSGAQTINMTADGYSTMNISGMALAYTPTNNASPCDYEDEYVRITTHIKGVNWYDDVTQIAVEDYDNVAKNSTITPIVYAIGEVTKVIPNNQFTFSKLATPAAANITVDAASGVVTISGEAIAGEQAVIKATAKNKASLTATFTVTVAGE